MRIPFASRNINVPKRYTNPHNNRRVRHGKTAKDKASGAWASRFSRQAARAAWQNDRNASALSFPV